MCRRWKQCLPLHCVQRLDASEDGDLAFAPAVRFHLHWPGMALNLRFMR
jgi:hypothetical protein